ncbi:MAG: nucleoside-triphosphatase [Myxococcales bacterium]
MVRWALISGESGVENADLALSVVARLESARVRTAGFVQHKWRNESGEKRYELVRLHHDEKTILAVDGVAAKGPNEEFFCSMAFHNEGFDAALRWIREDLAGADLVLLDGISKLEVSGKGHSATLEHALRHSDALVLICVRASQLSYVMERFALSDEGLVAALELPADESALDGFVGDLRASCHGQRANR